MKNKLAKKITIYFITLLGALTFTFFLIRAMPGDVVHTWALDIMAQRGLPYQEAYEIAKTMLNYDPTVPIYIQYAKYLRGLIQGNLGVSLTYRVPVTDIIRQALPWTLFLCTTALLISFLIGIAVGLLMAWKRKSLLEPFISFYASITQAIPDFLIGLILLVLLGVRLRLFPLHGAYDIEVTPGLNIPFLLSAFQHSILPIFAYVLQNFGVWALAMKASATSVIQEEYITIAKARGLSERTILINYVGKNAILPLITSLALALAGMLGGAMFIETIFGYPGIGFFFAQAIATRDYSLIQGLFLLTTFAIICINILVDIVYVKLDPRIKV